MISPVIPQMLLTIVVQTPYQKVKTALTGN